MTLSMPDDHARARDYLLGKLSDDPIRWEVAQDDLGGMDPGRLTAVLNQLETEQRLVYARDGIRRTRPGDPGPADLDDVAAAVLSLDWTPGRTHRGRTRPTGAWTIREAYDVGLGGRFRHVDVYNAMHERLKGRELELHGQQWWVRAGQGVTVYQLAVEESDDDVPTLEQELAVAIADLPAGATDEEDLLDDELVGGDEPLLVARRRARQLERELCDRFAAQRGIPTDDIEYTVVTGRVDVLDRRRRRVVEAKLDRKLTSVCQAVGQAEGYLFALRRFESVAVEGVAVLLPSRPTDLVLDYLEQLIRQGRSIGLVYLDGDTFVEHAFPL